MIPLIIIGLLALICLVMLITILVLTAEIRELKSSKNNIAHITKNMDEREFVAYVGNHGAFVYMLVGKHKVFVKKFDDDDMVYNTGLANELVEHLNEKL